VSILAAAPIGSVLQQLNHGSGIIDVAAALQRIRDDLHPGQLEFVDDQTTQILGVSAGYGAGKTRALCAKAVHLAAVNQGFIGCGDGAHRSARSATFGRMTLMTSLSRTTSRTPSGLARYLNMCCTCR
jgi:hypothetical protein